MRLSPGSKLGPYEIVAPIGAGGMGEVYRARDTRLGRDVAIKVLPAHRGEDPHALERLEREAQAVAALSHPNILAIHDVGRHEDVFYTVSEMLEGETLAQRLATGPLPVRKACELTAQVARGLAAAHARGIVHRDLKPDNLFVTGEGRIKILDFGLAKFSAPPASGEDRTVTAGPKTEPGTVMGTVGYMAPEQVRGLATDHRTDIFALGAIAFEMLTGRRAFAGETPADTSSAILNEDPPESSDGQRDVPAGVDTLIRHCLEKNPEERFQSARDLAFALEQLSSPSQHSVEGVLPVVERAPRRGARAWAVPALLVLLPAVAVAAYWIGAGSHSSEAPEFQRLTFRRGSIRAARAAADGQTVVYGAAWDGQPIRLYTTRLGSPASRALDLPDADILAISSRDEMAISLGRTFLSPYQNSGTLARVPLSGGAPRLLLEDVQEADWSPDGSELAVVHEVEGRNRLEYPIGTVLYETPGWISGLRVSPDGRRVAFFDHDQRWDNAGWVATVDRAGGRERIGPRWDGGAEGLAWSVSGDEIWFTAGLDSGANALHAVTPSGHLRTINRQAMDLVLFDVMPDGRALLVSASKRRETRFGTGGAERDLSWLDWSLGTFLSRDGAWVLLNEQGEGGGTGYSIYLRRTDGSPPVHIGGGVPMALSPDGRWVLAGLPTGAKRKVVVYPTGAGSARQLAEVGIRTWGAWFPDSQRVLYVDEADTDAFSLYVHEIGGDRQRLPYESFSLQPFCDAVAPDGKRFLARRLAGPPHILTVDGAEPQPVPGLDEADSVIRWSDDGRWIYYYRQGMPAAYGRVEVETGRRESLGELAPPDRAGAVGIWPALVSGDGRSYAYSYPRFICDLYLVDHLD